MLVSCTKYTVFENSFTAAYLLLPLPCRPVPGFVNNTIYADDLEPGWGWQPYNAKNTVLLATGEGMGGSTAMCATLSENGAVAFVCRECTRPGYQPFAGTQRRVAMHCMLLTVCRDSKKGQTGSKLESSTGSQSLALCVPAAGRADSHALHSHPVWPKQWLCLHKASSLKEPLTTPRPDYPVIHVGYVPAAIA